MLRNIFIITVRNLWRNKVYSLINIFGLAVGLTAAILVIMYVQDELSYDQFHEKKQNIYRLGFEEQRDDNLLKYAKIPFPAKEVLLQNIPDIKDITRMYSNTKVGGPVMFQIGQEIYAEENLYFVDPNYFDFFDFNLFQGDSKTALENINSVVITEQIALKYFGRKEVIGESITVNFGRAISLEVTGVMENLPENSHIAFDILLPVKFLQREWIAAYDYDFERDWKWSGAYTYLLLNSNSDIRSLESKLPVVVKEFFEEIDPASFILSAIPMTDIHLYSNYTREMNVGGSIIQIYALGIIAGLILIIASINFMNLATARSLKRSKEVGIRKVMGAARFSLILQFMSEALMISIISLIHSLLLVNLLLPAFNYFMGKAYIISEFLMEPSLMIGALLTTVMVGIISGIYPALFLSSFSPSQALKKNQKGSGHLSTRKLLVILQFTVSIVFILAVIVVHQQLSFISDKDLGFDKDQVLIVHDKSIGPKRYKLWHQEVMKHPTISDTYYGHIPGKSMWSNTITPEGALTDEGVPTKLLYAGYNIVDFFGLKLIEGRGFQKGVDNDTILDRSSFILNESMVSRLGWKNKAIGKEIEWVGGTDNKTLIKGKVVGVIQDFHQESLHQPIAPLLIKLADWGDKAVKFNSNQNEETRAFVEASWKGLFPDRIFSYSYLDDYLSRQYDKENKLSKMIIYFTSLAIFISCLGLFGLVAYVTEQRNKEFAIRKTLGATVSQITTLVARDFLKLVIVASVIACPMGWYVMREWLNGFAYQVTLSTTYFLEAVLVSVFVALATIIYHALKAAESNPVDSLRNE
ncbi:MAG: FtsX-like permease family protein [Cyclobacteriaceae bacterium]